MSIAQGLISGYNLVQGTKQFNENARLREKQLADNAAYREESLELQRQANQNLADYRSENLALQDKIAGLGRHLQNVEITRRYSGRGAE